MSPVDARTIRAITFDCYGTLIDWEAGIRRYIEPILRRSTPAGRARPEITALKWVEEWEPIQFRLLDPWRPYREVLARSVEETMRHFGLECFADDGPGLARSVAEWTPFSDTTRALRRLARRHRLAIVSNIDRDLLAGSVGQLQAPLSLLITAEDAQAYKPDRRPFELALKRLGVPAGEVLHAAFGWRYDLGPARALGMKTAFVNRSGGPRPDGEPPDLEVPSLQALADALEVPPSG